MSSRSARGGMPSPAMTASRHTAPLATAPRRRGVARLARCDRASRSEEHTSELQSLMRSSYAVFCLKKKTIKPQRLPTCIAKYHTYKIQTLQQNSYNVIRL